MNTTVKRNALLVFARNPVAGQVKTRLIPTLGASGAAQLYRQLLCSTLEAAAAVESADLTIYTDDEANMSSRPLAERYGARLAVQRGQDLGERMKHALCDSLRNHERAVLIGSDCAQFNPDYLVDAFDALHTNDVVIGPATDGGYLLIGCKQNHSALFAPLPWGSNTILESTRTRLRRLGLRWHELTALRDVDNEHDLIHLQTLPMEK